jgi:hypothetical protein
VRVAQCMYAFIGELVAVLIFVRKHQRMNGGHAVNYRGVLHHANRADAAQLVEISLSALPLPT